MATYYIKWSIFRFIYRRGYIQGFSILIITSYKTKTHQIIFIFIQMFSKMFIWIMMKVLVVNYDINALLLQGCSNISKPLWKPMDIRIIIIYYKKYFHFKSEF